jgi:condensin complex subunit 1
VLKEFDHAQLGEEILREIAAKSFNAQDTKGPRNFSRFLTQFAEWAPRAVLKQISLLLSHLDSEVLFPTHTLILFDCLRGLTLHKLSDAHGDHRNHWLSHTRARLLGRPHERRAPNAETAQRSSPRAHSRPFLYMRSKVFTVLSRLCDLPMKFPKLRLVITRAAASALEDKGAGAHDFVDRQADGDTSVRTDAWRLARDGGVGRSVS